MRRDTFNPIFDLFPPEEIVSLLAPFLLEKRRLKIDDVMNNRLNSLQLAFEGPSDVHNALAAMRTAEALGVRDVHMIATQIKGSLGRRSAAGALYWLNLHHHKTTANFFSQNRDYLVAGAAVDAELTLEELPIERPLCLLFGNEHLGLTKEALTRVDLKFKIPMFGMMQSYNLSISAAIALYEIAKRRRAYLQRSGDLSLFETQVAVAQAYIETLGAAKAFKILLNLKERRAINRN